MKLCAVADRAVAAVSSDLHMARLYARGSHRPCPIASTLFSFRNVYSPALKASNAAALSPKYLDRGSNQSSSSGRLVERVIRPPSNSGCACIGNLSGPYRHSYQGHRGRCPETALAIGFVQSALLIRSLQTRFLGPGREAARESQSPRGAEPPLGEGELDAMRVQHFDRCRQSLAHNGNETLAGPALA